MRQLFEKLRKDELAGKAKSYYQIFLENKFLKDVYMQNLKAAKVFMQTFKRNIYHTY